MKNYINYSTDCVLAGGRTKIESHHDCFPPEPLTVGGRPAPWSIYHTSILGCAESSHPACTYSSATKRRPGAIDSTGISVPRIGELVSKNRRRAPGYRPRIFRCHRTRRGHRRGIHEGGTAGLRGRLAAASGIEAVRELQSYHSGVDRLPRIEGGEQFDAGWIRSTNSDVK